MKSLLVVVVLVVVLVVLPVATYGLRGWRKGVRVRAMVADSPQLPATRLREVSMAVLAILAERAPGRYAYAQPGPVLDRIGIEFLSREHIDASTYLLAEGLVEEQYGKPVLISARLTEAGRAALAAKSNPV